MLDGRGVELIQTNVSYKCAIVFQLCQSNHSASLNFTLLARVSVLAQQPLDGNSVLGIILLHFLVLLYDMELNEVTELCE